VSNARYAGLTVTHLEPREGETVMQAYGAARGGVATIPRRGGTWLEALLTVATILVIVALMALMTRGMVAPADTGWVGAQDAKAGVVGSAIVHDDAGSVHSGLAPGYAPVHDDAGNVR
jgi:hypothetical protein